MTKISDDVVERTSDADAWHVFLAERLDNRANHPNGLTYAAVQIAEAIDRASARLPCGHHHSLAVVGVETGTITCELCDTRSRRNDAEAMEAEFRAAITESVKAEREACRRICRYYPAFEHGGLSCDPHYVARQAALEIEAAIRARGE